LCSSLSCSPWRVSSRACSFVPVRRGALALRPSSFRLLRLPALPTRPQSLRAAVGVPGERGAVREVDVLPDTVTPVGRSRDFDQAVYPDDSRVRSCARGPRPLRCSTDRVALRLWTNDRGSSRPAAAEPRLPALPERRVALYVRVGHLGNRIPIT